MPVIAEHVAAAADRMEAAAKKGRSKAVTQSALGTRGEVSWLEMLLSAHAHKSQALWEMGNAVVKACEMKQEVTPSAASRGSRRLTTPLAHHTTTLPVQSTVAKARAESVSHMLLPGACKTQVMQRRDGT